MTNKKRRRRHPSSPARGAAAATRRETASGGPAAARTPPSRTGAKPARREHKEEARRADVYAALKKLVGLPSNKNTLLAPYRDFSDPTTALAFTAWNKLQTCPSTITAAQASSVAYGFEYAFACTGNAPEPKAASNGC